MKSPSLFLISAALAFPLAALAADHKSLRDALTHHVSFDRSLDADFSRGDKTAHIVGGGKQGSPALADVIKIEPSGGKYGGAVHVVKKNPLKPAYNNAGILDYKTSNWSGSVSVWLKLTPDEDLEPGYCDPVQIIGGDTNKGFMFLEWSKDETPRYFRYAIRPRVELWNPQKKDWAKMTNAERPMVQVERAPFSRDKWTHVVFTFDRLNSGKAGSGKLFIDGKLQGTIKDWDLTMGWEPEKVQLMLFAAYVGRMDDLAVFNRALTDAEVQQVMKLPQGVKGLR